MRNAEAATISMRGDELSNQPFLTSGRVRSTLQSHWAAWLILIVSLALTAVAWSLSNQYIQRRARDRFDFRVDQVLKAIDQRMLEYEQVLRGGIGLYNSSKSVTREEWRVYATNSQLQRFYPGIQGMGVSLIVEPEEKEEFERLIRQEGFPDFQIRPAGERDFYTAIVFLEPFDWRNQRAFGYDMCSEPTRRAAAMHAIDTGNPAVSGMVTLVQETDKDTQKGFLVYLPLFDPALPVDTVERRRAAATGFVYAPFRAADLMHGILQSGVPDINFRIYDSVQPSSESLMYESENHDAFGAEPHQPDFKSQRELKLHGRSWTLTFESEQGFVSRTESWPSFLVGCGGLLIDLLLFYVIGTIGTQQRTAKALATQMTAAYRRTEKQFRAVFDTSLDPILLVDGDQRVLYANPAAEAVFGAPSQQLLSRSLLEFFVDASPALSAGPPGSLDQSSVAIKDEFDCKRADSTTFPADVTSSAWEDEGRTFMAVVVRDISDQKQKDQTIRQQIQELERSNRDLDDFAYVASHDLRSPLRGIENLANWVVEDASEQLPEDSKKHLSMIIGRIGVMQSLLTDLLAYSRVGRISEKVTEVDTQAMTESVIEILDKPAGFRVQAFNLPIITTLKTPLQTCLRNLIDNAIKHHDRDDGKVAVTCEMDDANTCFLVTDDGPGIPLRSQERIFNIFQTLQPKVGPRAGSGIGLSIIKRTVESYGGSITVESEVGQGAKFRLTIPRVIQRQETVKR
ncbi:CHASE domain-containing protein [Neorhodopirellula lusitana]|uniref:CHASE domain-containing protein n=1 Tax=Neorhodopirellula lusitana TaxID=445327 RepID=UPI00384D6D80